MTEFIETAVKGASLGSIIKKVFPEKINQELNLEEIRKMHIFFCKKYKSLCEKKFFFQLSQPGIDVRRATKGD